tara:strand:+ start:46 stop:336 length:291 start_codon:yes stop_codon:yes gene_type:complete
MSLIKGIVDIGDLCTHCHRDTSYGSGLFVNRIPSGTETENGYMCPDCQMYECDRCDKLIDCDDDILVDTPTHTDRVHYECLTHKERVEYKLNGGSE